MNHDQMLIAKLALKHDFAYLKPLLDPHPRRFDVLNRKERQTIKSWERNLPAHLKELKMNNLKEEIVVKDADGTDIFDNPDLKTYFTIGKLCQQFMATPHQSDQQQGWKEKNERGLLLKRIDATLEGDGRLELTAAEINLLKNRLGLFLLQARLVTRAGELLDQEWKPVV